MQLIICHYVMQFLDGPDFCPQLRARIVCAAAVLIAANAFQFYVKPEAPSDKALDHVT
ncbi:hypothetical protein B0G81_1760 [Paraburkholderia sp. BL6665CI2N2]|uniref:hypothetical protein n=1 Tax=Paraburkholderia sp. BL6665CI2N2 TaxID=1938806 RepID=UPI0010D1392C|nr:hypothetical protein [Paraburkholderia sp. BL6665CI2N2]TDY21539.1 hypothetical protein B0G81_1760 [Paraburkholderia sp. BL6665CI2N2]